MHIGSLGLPELLIILVIVIVIFGAKKLPDLGKSLGEGIKNFKGSVSNKDKDKDNPDDKNAPFPKS
jgi:sec-independent protein translocase protein TatA